MLEWDKCRKLLWGWNLAIFGPSFPPPNRRFGPNKSTVRFTAKRWKTWSRSRTLPALLREDLASSAELGLPALDRRYESTDGTRRYLLRLGDGRTVETVLMPEEDRDTVCISSQVGCPVDCKFCMTALMGLERSLTAGEIVGQVLFVAQDNGLLADTTPLQHRDDGDGRAAAESAECSEGHAHSVRSRRRWDERTAHYGFDFRNYSAD